MAAKDTSETTSYHLSDFVKKFQLPQSVMVTESNHLDIGASNVMRLLRIKTVCFLSGVTTKGKQKVLIPTDCQEKVEVPYSLSILKFVETAEELAQHWPRVRHVRVLRDDEGTACSTSLKAGEMLELIFLDNDKGCLIAVNDQGCEVRLPMSCSVGFRLLEYGSEFTLADLVKKRLLPRNVRFVRAIPLDVRETFIEKDHDHDLGVVYIEGMLSERRGVEVAFNNVDNGETISWLSLCDVDITVSLLGSNVGSEPSTAGTTPVTDHSPDPIYEEMLGLSPTSKASPDKPAKYDSFNDIPSDLSELSVEDVGSLLERLKMGKYKRKFAEEQVDGHILMEMKEDIFTEHFGLNLFHALKLSKFIKGYRPRFSSSD